MFAAWGNQDVWSVWSAPPIRWKHRGTAAAPPWRPPNNEGASICVPPYIQQRRWRRCGASICGRQFRCWIMVEETRLGARLKNKSTAKAKAKATAKSKSKSKNKNNSKNKNKNTTTANNNNMRTGGWPTQPSA